MEKQDINNLIREALEILRASSHDMGNQESSGAIKLHKETTKKETLSEYWKTGHRIFGINPDTKKPIIPQTSITVINKIKAVKVKSTLRMYVRSVNYVASEWLKFKINQAESAKKAGKWAEVEEVVACPSFFALMELAKMKAAEYTLNWAPQSKRKSKKVSLRKLPKDWREQMADAAPDGQFRIPMLVAMITGCRPAELEKGVVFLKRGNKLAVHINSVKVTEDAGQTYRIFTIADHPIKDKILEYMDTQENKNQLSVKVSCGNSVSTYMREIGKKLWPGHKEEITVYTARHGMAADCKNASHNGADPDLASKVLGHRVDKTVSYYGDISQAGGISVAPLNVKVTHPVKNKSKAKNSLRKTPSQLKKLRQGMVM